MIVRAPIDRHIADSFVKVVVDVRREILAMGCELHSDCADELAGDGSARGDLWGANWYPAKREIAFVSLINIRPTAGNRSMEIQLPDVRESVERIIRKLLDAA